MTPQELEFLIKTWDQDAERTIRVLEALPRDQYDFRPDPKGRSIGELAWHLAEGDAYNAMGVETGRFSPDMRPPGMERPRQIEALAPGYARVHREAVARILKVSPTDLERPIEYFTNVTLTGAEILWGAIFHNVHHRGQLCLMCRLAGGVSPGIFGPNREEMAALPGK